MDIYGLVHRQIRIEWKVIQPHAKRRLLTETL